MPNREFNSYILRGIAEGFHIGFDARRVSALISAKLNMSSAREHPTIVAEYLKEECQLGRVIGPIHHGDKVKIVKDGPFSERGQTGSWPHGE